MNSTARKAKASLNTLQRLSKRKKQPYTRAPAYVVFASIETLPRLKDYVKELEAELKHCRKKIKNLEYAAAGGGTNPN